MPRFLVYRNGSNAANQPMNFRMPVSIVTAENESEARRIAEENVTFYSNQSSEAVEEIGCDPDDWNRVSEMAAESRQFNPESKQFYVE